AASGRVDFDRLVEQVALRCEYWPAVDAPRETPPTVSKRSFEVVYREASTQEYILQLSDAPASEDDSRYAAKLLAVILGDDSGSRMYWEITDPGLAETASLGHYEYQGAGMFYTWLACEPDQAEANLERVDAIYRAVESQGVTANELDQAKNKV